MSANSAKSPPASPPPEEKLRPYAESIAAATECRGLPFWLVVAVIAQESDFDAEARSSAGAIGLMQIMPATAADCGVAEKELLDPAKNIWLGCRILADRYDVFQSESGDERWKFALAAYNGGEAPIINAQALALRRGLNPALWDDLAQVLPETQVRFEGRWISPDYRQITEYVAEIWRRFAAWRNRPSPTPPTASVGAK